MGEGGREAGDRLIYGEALCINQSPTNVSAHSDAFPAKAGPTKSTAYTLWNRLDCRTGFSREALDLLLMCF